MQNVNTTNDIAKMHSPTTDRVIRVTKRKFNDIVHIDPERVRQFIIDNTPSEATGAYKFKFTYLAESILTKYFEKGVSDPGILKQAAFASFDQGEDDCRRINQSGLNLKPSIIESARRLVSTVLGPFSYENVLLNCKHGSGATYSRPRAFGEPHNKYAVSQRRRYYSRKRRKFITNRPFLSVTPLAYKYWSALCESTPILKDIGDHKNVYLVRGNKLDTVPKNSKTDRTIAKEPDINMFLQLGVGDYLARRLTFFKNSKYDQTRNQNLALLGSIYGHLATIDLSRASDSLSFKLVYELLPPDWFEYLDSIRSHYYVRPDETDFKQFEKFCTMGNGFCFELQTIIFLCLALAASNAGLEAVGDRFSTYGDDIICPTSVAPDVVKALEGCGFTVNPEKSFITGPFRESCGKHYYQGMDVTPFYIRKPLDSVHRVCWFLNSLRKWAFDEKLKVCDDTVYPLWLETYKSNVVLRKLRGGRDVNRTDYVVTPGRPSGKLVAKTTKIVINELGAYVCKLSQGLISNDKVPEMMLYDEDNMIIFDSYHYTIHPESDAYNVIGLIPNHDEAELPVSEYKFVTELV